MNSIPRTWDSTPEEQKKRHPGNNTTMATGVLFREDNPYVVDRVLTETPADFDSNPIKPGDRLVAVNGNRSRPEHQPGTVFLIGHSAQRGSPEICKAGNQGQYDVKLHTISTAGIRNFLYTEWEDANREYVENVSKGNPGVCAYA